MLAFLAVCRRNRSAWLGARALACVVVSLAACVAEPIPFEEPELSLSFVAVETRTSEAEGQTLAHMELTGLAFVPGTSELIAWEKNGRIVHYRRDDDDVLTRLGELRLPDIEQETDCGLISLAFDPDWEDNHFLFAGHCISPTYSAVTRYEFAPDTRDFDYDAVGDSGVRIMEFGDERSNRAWHNVGALGFFDDAEHSMWVLCGDKRVNENGQSTRVNLGGILRIIPSRAAKGGYEPHPDNPFGGVGSDPELQSSPDLYAWGLRSPWRGVLDERGRIWIGDVGENYEEVDLATEPGQNFGWDKADGPCREDDDCDGLSDPLLYWGRSSNHRYVREDASAEPSSGRVSWVGAAYRASERDPYRGILNDATLVSDMCVGFVRAVSVDDDGEVVRDEQIGHLVGLSGAAQAPDGQLYVTSYGDCTSDSYGVRGGIYRAALKERAAPPPQSQRTSHLPLIEDPLGPMPARLSETGLFEDMVTRKPAAQAFEYEPSLPLWSNGSDKQRFVVLPPGEHIDNSDRNHWEFPVGTLFVKTFNFPEALDPDPIETRIIRRVAEGWDYQTYRWRNGDAYLLALDRSIPARIRGPGEQRFDHMIPSRFDCRSCHEHNETVIIGFDELRLNSVTGDDVQTQLELLAARDLFSTALPEEPRQITGDDPRERAVVSYLHGNCAHCHNGSPRSEGPLDLTFPVALRNIIGRETEGSGQAAGVRVVPGAPEESVLFLAFAGEGEETDIKAMPPVGVQLPDAETIELFREWISDLPSE
jgi:hypothetical protein